DGGVGRVAERDRAGQRVCGRGGQAGISKSHVENLVALANRIIVDADADGFVGFAGLKYKLTAASGRGHPGITAKLQRADLREIIALRAAGRRTVASGEINAHRVHSAADPPDVEGGKTGVFKDRIRRRIKLQDALIVFDDDRCPTLRPGRGADRIGKSNGERLVSLQQSVVSDWNLD